VELAAAVGPAGGRVAAAGRELERYFAGRLRRFRTPVDLRLGGSSFGRTVLEVVHSIPYGELWTYGDVAGLAGRPGAARAAGTWLRRSPIELFVPCHRVVPSGPGLGTYGDDGRRATLLRLERAI
jgi:methylated-DNA-[protein]-cysteine S-methyltransferase